MVRGLHLFGILLGEVAQIGDVGAAEQGVAATSRGDQGDALETRSMTSPR
jgi:hypothetical protein